MKLAFHYLQHTDIESICLSERNQQKLELHQWVQRVCAFPSNNQQKLNQAPNVFTQSARNLPSFIHSSEEAIRNFRSIVDVIL